MGTDALLHELAVYEGRIAVAEDARHPDPVVAERYRERAAAVRALLGVEEKPVERRPSVSKREKR